MWLGAVDAKWCFAQKTTLLIAHWSLQLAGRVIAASKPAAFVPSLLYDHTLLAAFEKLALTGLRFIRGMVVIPLDIPWICWE